MFRKRMRLFSLSRCLRARAGLLLATLLLAPLAVQAQPNAPNCCNVPGSNCQTEADWIQGFYDYVYYQCQPQAHASGLGGSGAAGPGGAQGLGGPKNSGGGGAQGLGGPENSGGGGAPVVQPMQQNQNARGFQGPVSNPVQQRNNIPLENPTSFDATEPEEFPLTLVEPENRKPPTSPVGEMLDLANQGLLPNSNPDQEHLPDMQRCSTKPWTSWHLRNCAYSN